MPEGRKEVKQRRQRPSQVLKEILPWVQRMKFGDVSVVQFAGGYAIGVRTTTTSTRASSIVTRLQLLLEDIAKSRGISINKSPIGPPPPKRGDIGVWLITITIPNLAKKS